MWRDCSGAGPVYLSVHDVNLNLTCLAVSMLTAHSQVTGQTGITFLLTELIYTNWNIFFELQLIQTNSMDSRSQGELQWFSYNCIEVYCCHCCRLPGSCDWWKWFQRRIWAIPLTSICVYFILCVWLGPAPQTYWILMSRQSPWVLCLQPLSRLYPDSTRESELFLTGWKIIIFLLVERETMNKSEYRTQFT